MTWLATPRTPWGVYPNRPMDNREKRAAWAVKYYARYAPHTHPTKREQNDE